MRVASRRRCGISRSRLAPAVEGGRGGVVVDVVVPVATPLVLFMAEGGGVTLLLAPDLLRSWRSARIRRGAVALSVSVAT